MGKQVGISVDTANGNVVISYQEKVGWLEFSPHQAVEYAEAILNKAIYLAEKKQSPIIIPRVN